MNIEGYSEDEIFVIPITAWLECHNEVLGRT